MGAPGIESVADAAQAPTLRWATEGDGPPVWNPNRPQQSRRPVRPRYTRWGGGRQSWRAAADSQTPDGSPAKSGRPGVRASVLCDGEKPEAPAWGTGLRRGRNAVAPQDLLPALPWSPGGSHEALCRSSAFPTPLLRIVG